MELFSIRIQRTFQLVSTHYKHTQLFHYRLCLLYQYWSHFDVNNNLFLLKYMSMKCAYLQYHEVDDTAKQLNFGLIP